MCFTPLPPAPSPCSRGLAGLSRQPATPNPSEILWFSSTSPGCNFTVNNSLGSQLPKGRRLVGTHGPSAWGHGVGWCSAVPGGKALPNAALLRQHGGGQQAGPRFHRPPGLPAGEGGGGERPPGRARPRRWAERAPWRPRRATRPARPGPALTAPAPAPAPRSRPRPRPRRRCGSEAPSERGSLKPSRPRKQTPTRPGAPETRGRGRGWGGQSGSPLFLHPSRFGISSFGIPCSRH